MFGTVQGTGGSTAIANSFLQLRYAGAKARLMLVNAAAKVWQVSPLTITTQNNVISHLPSQRSAIYGQMAELAALQTVPTDELVTLKDPSNFKLVGKSGTKRKDHGKSNGTATFTIDVQLEGLRTALVAHPPAFGATVTSFDASETKKSPGVIDVIQIPSGIAVVAEDFWSAKVGRDKLDIVWDRSGFTKSTNALKKEYVELANTPGASARNDGDADKILEQSSEVVEASYYFPYLAHAPMEPMNCVILADKDKAELWYGCQLQTLDQFAVADVLNVHPNKVMIHTLFAGGSFGRRANPQSDYVVEAASIAKQMRGVPIKLIWTREDDMRAGYYRPMYVHKIRASLDESGNIQAWQQRIVGQSIASGTPFEGFMIQNGVDASSVEGASTLPYHIPNFSVELHTTQLPVPVLWWRSVGHTHNAYSTETFIDELATKAGRDPVEFRQSMLEKHPRHKAVLKLAAEKANWGTPLPEGKGRGIAVHESFKSYVAEVAEVSVENGQIIVERVVCAVDCGLAINPDIIEAQMQGGIGFGLSPALLSQITLNEGGTVQSNFHDYLVLREQQMPKIEVHIVPSDVALLASVNRVRPHCGCRRKCRFCCNRSALIQLTVIFIVTH
nr:xanthine dehydrogenase family protein molybdopterin-binding subunit [Enterovibrio nigricans]